MPISLSDMKLENENTATSPALSDAEVRPDSHPSYFKSPRESRPASHAANPSSLQLSSQLPPSGSSQLYNKSHGLPGLFEEPGAARTHLTPAPNMANRVLKYALSGDNLRSEPNSCKGLGNTSPEDLRSKLLTLENKRLQGELNCCSAELYDTKDELSRCQRQLSRTEDDMGNLQQKLSRHEHELARNEGDRIDVQRRHELEVLGLTTELNHRKGLADAYQQVIVAQNRIPSADPRFSTLKRSRSPNTELAKSSLKKGKTNADSLSGCSPPAGAPAGLTPNASPRAPLEFMLAQRGLTGVLRSDTRSENTAGAHTSTSYDKYPHHNITRIPASSKPVGSSLRPLPFEGLGDRYRPPGNGGRSRIDRYIPGLEPSCASSSTSALSTDNSKRVTSTPNPLLPQQQSIRPLSSVPGTDLMEMRKMSGEMNNYVLRQGPYAHDGKQPGIPTPCRVCSITLPSRIKLDRHLRIAHGQSLVAAKYPGLFASSSRPR